VKAKPEAAKYFYILLNKSVKDLHTSEENLKNTQVCKVKNPEIIKQKGKVSFIYIYLFIINIIN